jgi:hypothetical protein
LTSKSALVSDNTQCIRWVRTQKLPPRLGAVGVISPEGGLGGLHPAADITRESVSINVSHGHVSLGDLPPCCRRGVPAGGTGPYR